jgi:hypothetical protein
MGDSGLLFFVSSFPYPSQPAPTRAYVTRMKDNVSRSFEPRHVIPDTRISSGQCPRCDVNVTWGARPSQCHTKKRALRHIHVKKPNSYGCTGESCVCSEVLTKDINALCGQKAEFFNITPYGTINSHWNLQCVTINETTIRGLHIGHKKNALVQHAYVYRFFTL